MPEGPVVNTNLGPAPQATANPIASAGGVVGIMNDLAELKNRQNTAALFQQQMAARQKLGEDLAVWAGQGLTPEQQIERASHQPYAPFVTPEIANFRTSNLAGVQVQEAQKKIDETMQRMTNAGLDPLVKAMVSTGGDPKKFDGAFKIATSGYPPEVQKMLRPAFEAFKSSITAGTAGLPPEAAKAAVIDNTRRLGAAFGLGLDGVYAASGGGVKPGVVALKGPHGEDISAVVSGGGDSPVKSNILSAGPTTEESKAMEARGTYSAGVSPHMESPEDAAGVKHPGVVSGGANGGPVMFSPLMTGSPYSGVGTGGAGTPAASSAASPTPDPRKEILSPSLAAGEFLKKTGELAGDIAKETSDNVAKIPVMAKRVETMVDALTKFQSGGLAPSREAIGKLMEGLKNAGMDISDEAIKKMANGSLADQQAFQSLISRAAVTALQADASGTGKVMRPEVDKYLSMIGDSQTPGALRTLLSNLKFNLAVGYDQAVKFREFKSLLSKKDPSVEGYEPSDFNTWYAEHFDEKNLATPKGMDLKEVPKGKLKGDTPAGLGVGESREAEPGVTIRRVK